MKNSLNPTAFLSLPALLLLTACGGGGGGGGGADTEAPVISLNGDSAIEVVQGADFTDPGATATDNEDTDPALSVSGDVDTMTWGDYTLTYTATDAAGNSSTATRTVSVVPASYLTVTALDYFDGSLIPSADLTLYWDSADTEGGSYSASTNDSGVARLGIDIRAESQNLTADADNYAEFGRNIALSASAFTAEIVPVNTSTSFAAGDATDLQVESASIVSLPANAFVDADGNLYSGNIDAELTILDPRRDPDVMPGDFETVDETSGEVSHIESFGAINATFTSDAGNPLSLASGQAATVRIPLSGDVADAPDTIPLYYFDDASGYWIEEGSATLTQIDGEYFYVGEVEHFTTWNADQIYNTTYINGCVENADGEPVSGAQVTATGESYTGTSRVYTNSDGNFRIPVRVDAYVRVSAAQQALVTPSRVYTTQTDEITDGSCLVLGDLEVTVTLTWGENPSDLDTHLDGPASATDSRDRFHLYYGNRDLSVGGETIYLDVDDTTSFGPEVTYLSDFPFDGTYYYSVYHYSGSSDIQASPARVELQINEDLYIYEPPAGTPSECWAVFTIDIASGAATVTEIGEWQTSTDCHDPTGNGDGGEEEYVEATSHSSGNNLYDRQLLDKYYVKPAR